MGSKANACRYKLKHNYQTGPKFLLFLNNLLLAMCHGLVKQEKYSKFWIENITKIGHLDDR